VPKLTNLKIDKSKKTFKNKKDLKLFIKNFLKTYLKGLPEEIFPQIEIEPLGLKPPKVRIVLPFYSEGNLIRANEVDFLLERLLILGVTGEILYLDDVIELRERDEQS